HRGSLDGLGSESAEANRPGTQRAGDARDPRARADPDPGLRPHAARDGHRPGLRRAGPSALTHPDRDAGRCDGGGGAAEHAGDERRVAELVARAAASHRNVEGERAGRAHRARPHAAGVEQAEGVRSPCYLRALCALATPAFPTITSVALITASASSPRRSLSSSAASRVTTAVNVWS